MCECDFMNAPSNKTVYPYHLRSLDIPLPKEYELPTTTRTASRRSSLPIDLCVCPSPPPSIMAKCGDLSCAIKFTGVAPYNSVTWIAAFDTHCDLRNLEDDKIKLGSFSASLTGKALTWYQALGAEHTDTFDHVKAAFEKRYKPSGAAKWRGALDLMLIKQELDEDVQDYMDRVMALAKQFDISGDQLFTTILGGMLSSMQEEVLKKDIAHKDLTKLREQAVLAQAAKPPAVQDPVMAISSRPADNRDYRRSPSPYTGRSQQRAYSPRRAYSPARQTGYDASRQTSEARPASHIPQRKAVSFETPYCKFCGGERHQNLSQCFARSKQCFACLKWGHISRVCMSKQQF